MRRSSDRAAEIVRMLQVRSQCPSCKRRCYASRKTAKYAARLLYPGTHMGKYRCGGFWHLTSMTEPAVLRRRRSRPGTAGVRTPAAA
jgi:hypothetical protein